MSVFSFRFSLQFSGDIWQIAASDSGAYLVLELRNNETQSISYQLLELNKNTVAEFDFSAADWWTTLLKLKYPHVFFEKYLNPENPIEKNLVIYSLQENCVIDEIENFQLEEIKNGYLMGSKPGNPDETREIPLKYDYLETVPLISPFFYDVDSEGYQMILEYLNNSELNFGCEYLEYANYIIICYFERLGTKFVRKLLVIAGDTEIYHEPIDTGLEGYASGGFFVYDNVLFFIQNSNQLHGIQL